MNYLVEADRAITLWINSLGSSSFDPFWSLMSNSRLWFPLYAVVFGFLIYRFGWKKGLALIASLLLCVLLTDQLSGAVKNTVGRLRPCFSPVMLEMGLRHPEVHHHLYGFFSSHACNCFGFAACSYLALRNDAKRNYRAYGICIFLWAAMTSISRIMLAAHYFADIVVGGIVGIGLGTAVALTASRLTRKL